MHIAIVLLSLGVATAIATGSLADHAELTTNRNLAAVRAERSLDEFVKGCGSGRCNPNTVNNTRIDGTVLTGCVHQAAGSAALRVQAKISWTPRVFTGLTPATATTIVPLDGLSAPVVAVVREC